MPGSTSTTGMIGPFHKGLPALWQCELYSSRAFPVVPLTFQWLCRDLGSRFDSNNANSNHDDDDDKVSNKNNNDNTWYGNCIPAEMTVPSWFSTA